MTMEDGGGIGQGDHFLPHDSSQDHLNAEHFHKTNSECCGGHQAPRKAVHSLWKKVGQNIKDKKRDKRIRDGELSREGSREGEVSK